MSHALISGSFALQFFERVMWRDSELDIYVQDRKRARRCCIGPVTKYLIEFEGYRFQGVDRIARAARKSSAKEASQQKREKEGPSSCFGHEPANAVPSPFVSWDLTHFCCLPGKNTFKKTPVSVQPFNLELNESFSDITAWIEKVHYATIQRKSIT